MRKQVHVGMSVLLIIVIIAYKYILSSNVIDSLLTVAGYTYGPLLGLFAFGILTNYQIKDKYVFWVCLSAVGLISFIGQRSTHNNLHISIININIIIINIIIIIA